MDSSSKLYSSSSSKPMGEAVNINSSNNSNSGMISSNSGMISSSSTSSSSRNRSKEMENLSFEISKYPRDLLQTFRGSSNSSNPITRTSSSSRSEEPKLGEEEDEEEGLNLGLGLSLGGIFGVDKSKNMGLIRSSSIAGTMPLHKDDDMGVKPPPTTPGSNLVRTSSLPVETEEEWRKRKELQTLRRMEAKRRRSEKQKVLKEGGGGGGAGGGGGSGGEDKGGAVEGLKLRARLEREQQCLGITSKLIGSSMGNLFGSPKPPPPSSCNNSTIIINNNNMEVKGRRTTFGSLQGFLIAQAQAQTQDQDQAQSQSQSQSQSQPQSPSQSQYQSQYQPHLQPRQGSSQGSEGSQGASSDASELESKPLQGSSSCGEARSPASIQSLQDRGSQESIGHMGTKDDSIHRACGPEGESLSKQSSKQSESAVNKRKETAGSSGIEDMPCVFTIGDGPHGRKVEGILYKYGKGEEVRIMCVCHGNFFSPSEFVKHAGGKDVEHPLRHIVVSPSTSAFQ